VLPVIRCGCQSFTWHPPPQDWQSGRGQWRRSDRRRAAGGWPPGVVLGSARHAWIASSVNQTVKLPRRFKEASYSAQFVTRFRGFGM
jgi:hypothetical protein